MRGGVVPLFTLAADGNLLHHRRIRVGADMGFEAMNGRFVFVLVLDPTGSTIALTGRSEDGRIDQCARLDLDHLGFELSGDRV